jgi:HAMP domain-containing protein
MTVVAVGISLVAFDRVGNTLEDVTDRSMPAVVTALGLAVESANVAAVAPGLISAETAELRDAVKAQMEVSVKSIDDALARIGTTAPTAAAEMLKLQKVLFTQMTTLETAVEDRSAARDRLIAVREEVLKLHKGFLSAMLPVVDDANFNLMIAGSDTVDEAEATIAKLVDEEVEKLRGALTLSADGQRLMGIIFRSARTTDADELAEREAQFSEIAARMTASMSALPDTPDSESLKGVTELLLVYGEGDDSAFNLRRQEIRFGQLSATDRRKVEDARKALDSEVLEIGAEFDQAIAPVIAAARDSMKAGSANLSGDLRTKIDTLVETDVAGLVKMLSILAEANLAVGQLNAGASAPDADRMLIYRNAYENSAKVLTALADELETAGVDGSVIEQTRHLAALGFGANGVFPLRRAVLDFEQAALSALDETKRVAAEFDATVNALVDSAQSSATANAQAAAGAIQLSITVLAVLALVNVVVGVAIGWLIVNRQVVRRLISLSGVMRKLADGDNDIEIDAAGRDEIAQMASTVAVFRDNAREVEELRLQQEAAKTRAAEEAQRQRNELAKLVRGAGKGYRRRAVQGGSRNG